MDEYRADQIIKDQAATIRQLTMMLFNANDSLSMKNIVITNLNHRIEVLEREKESLRVQPMNAENRASCGNVQVLEALRDLEARIVECVHENLGAPKIGLVKVLRGPGTS